MADLKKTVAIEFETNAAKAARETDKLAKSQRSVAKSSDETGSKQKKLASEIKSTAARTRVLNMELRNSRARLADMSKGARGFGAKLSSAKGSILAFTAAAAGMAAAMDQAVDRSFKLQAVQQNLPFSIGAAQKASKGLTDDLTLMTNAITANRLGVAKNSEEYAKIVEIGQKLALSTGQDAAKGVEDLTTALARQSPMILDNLGISLKLSEAYDRYAETLGKTANELTDAEKKMAFMTEALKAGEKAASDVKLEFDEATLKAKEFKVEVKNLADTLSVQLLAGLSDISSGMEITLGKVTGLTRELKKLDDAAGGRTSVRGAGKHGILLPGDPGYLAQVASDEKMAEKARLDAKKAEDAEFVRQAQVRAREEQEAYDAEILRVHNKNQKNKGRGRNRMQFFSEAETSSDLAELRGFSDMSQDSSMDPILMSGLEMDIERLRAIEESAREVKEIMGSEEMYTEEDRLEAMRFEIAKISELEEVRENSHQAQIDRQRKQQEAERQRVAAMRQAARDTAAIGDASIQLTRAVGDAVSEGSRKQAEAVNKLEGVMTVGKGVAAIAQGAVEVASQNYAKGVAMILAGTAATVTGGMMIANPLNPPGGEGGAGGGGTASEFGPGTPPPGATPSPSSELPSGPISRPDTTAPPQQGGQNTSPSRGETRNVVVIENFNTLGTTNEEVANNIQQMLDDRDRMVGNA